MVGDSLVGLDTGQKTTGRRNDTSSALLCSEAAAVSQFASVPVWSYSMQEVVASMPVRLTPHLFCTKLFYSTFALFTSKFISIYLLPTWLYCTKLNLAM